MPTPSQVKAPIPPRYRPIYTPHFLGHGSPRALAKSVKNPHKQWLTYTRIIYAKTISRSYLANPPSNKGALTMGKTPSKPATTVTLKHLAAEIAEAHEVPKKQAEGMLNDLVDRLTKHLKKGSRIRLVGLGILQVRKRAARMGRNPATGEPIQIKASKKVAFRAAKELKESI